MIVEFAMWQPNRLEEERLEKARRLEALGIELFPRRVQRTHTAAEAIAAFEAAEKEANGGDISPKLP
jgi:lysyl-tRNA synthetase, class II